MVISSTKNIDFASNNSERVYLGADQGAFSKQKTRHFDQGTRRKGETLVICPVPGSPTMDQERGTTFETCPSLHVFPCGNPKTCFEFLDNFQDIGMMTM
jgi:hypothetical protein